MKRKQMFGVFALAMVFVIGLSMVSAHAFGKWNSEMSDEEKLEMQEHREAIKEVIESGDYEAWKELMLDRIAKMEAGLTEDRFNEISERHESMSEFRVALNELRESGDFSKEDIKNLKDEYGIEGRGFGKFFGKGKKVGCPMLE